MYEVDLPGNIARKQRILRRRFGRVPERVRLVAVDFETDDLTEMLTAQGFQPDLRSMFVIEAVTQYLSEEAVERLYGWDAVHRKWVVRDRAWTYGIAPDAVGTLLARHGWMEREQVGTEEYRSRYFEPADRDLTAMELERFVLAEKAS